MHLWIGAWGAIAAILFGFTGFMQNHRGIMKLPQGDSSEISEVELDVPDSARGSREALRAWLHDSQHIDVENQRGPGGRSGGEGGGRANQPGRWMFQGGNVRIQTQVEYVEGTATASVRKIEQSPLAVLERLHKGNGGGAPWILLEDSFALAMVALGISGLIMWGRGRSLKQMAFSIVGVAVIVVVVIGASAAI